MLLALSNMPKLPGHTAILIDVSGSMHGDYGYYGRNISKHSELAPWEAGAALGAMAASMSEDFTAYAFATGIAEIAPRQGMALIDAIRSVVKSGDVGHGTNIGASVTYAMRRKPDRVIVVTDCQSHDTVPNVKGYMIDVSAYEKGVGYSGDWIHINGFSEATLRYCREVELARSV